MLIIPPLAPALLTDNPGTSLNSWCISVAPDAFMSCSVITVAEPPKSENFISVLPIFGSLKIISSALILKQVSDIKNKSKRKGNLMIHTPFLQQVKNLKQTRKSLFFLKPRRKIKIYIWQVF